MNLILLDGGPASGKNTLGNLLLEHFKKTGDKTILLDLDTFVEEFNPKWIWENKEIEDKEKKEAIKSFYKEIGKNLQQGFQVIAIGRFLTKEELTDLIATIKINCPIFLFHLSAPLQLRKERLHRRGPHSLIDLEKDQKERNEIKNWYGCVYKNINSSEKDAENILKLIEENKGLINTSLFK